MSEQLIRDFGGELKEILTQLAHTLGVASELVFGILVRQQVAEGITNMCVALFFFIVTWISIHVYIKRVMVPTIRDYSSSYMNEEYIEDKKKLLWYLDNDDWAIGLGVVTGMLLIATLVVIPINLSFGIQKLINPEYFALKDIMDMIHPPAISK